VTESYAMTKQCSILFVERTECRFVNEVIAMMQRHPNRLPAAEAGPGLLTFCQRFWV
jgi:hypothetical protein